MEDQITPVSKETEPDTFHDQGRLIRLSVNANRISLVFLILFFIVVIALIYLLWQLVSSHASLEQIIYYFLIGIVPLFLGGLGWIGLQFISEGIYMLMDIEDNTRPKRNGVGQ